MKGERYDCRECTSSQQRKRGCHGNGSIKWQAWEDEYVAECPERFVQREGWRYMIWKRFKQMGLPFPGGHANQPVYITDIIQTLETEYDKILAEKGKPNG